MPDFRTIQDFFPFFENGRARLFEPGTKWSYSNAGFMVLGAIIEKATGQSYFAYVKENVFRRAGMNDTDFYETDRVTPNLAIGYTKQNRYLPVGAEWTNTLFISPVKEAARRAARIRQSEICCISALPCAKQASQRQN